MSGDESDVGSDDGLAPVIPLFGDHEAAEYPRTRDETQRELQRRLSGRGPSHRGDQVSSPTNLPSGSPRAGETDWRTEWDEDPEVAEITSGRDTANPPRRRRSEAGTGSGRRAARGGRDEADPVAAAESGLLKKLRTRQLSVSEARSFLSGLELPTPSVDAILEAFLERGYLDDARLAEQLVHAGVDRKGQGRQVIAQTLAKRGVPRDVADAALTELPDDDAERALEFARTKAGSLRGLERDVALRRLAGQLARRGYGGGIAFSAARTALDEATRPTGRVRFEER